jgi:rubrerythrin
MGFDSIDAILDFAIQKEQDAHEFYTELAENVERKAMKEVFLGFAKEELGHKAKLEGVKSGKKMLSSEKKVLDLKIGESLVEVEVKPNLSYQDALILAMKAEKNAYILYTSLASATTDAIIKETFSMLAQEEAKHKLRFEMEYDDYVLTDN